MPWWWWRREGGAGDGVGGTGPVPCAGRVAPRPYVERRPLRLDGGHRFCVLGQARVQLLASRGPNGLAVALTDAGHELIAVFLVRRARDARPRQRVVFPSGGHGPTSPATGLPPAWVEGHCFSLQFQPRLVLGQHQFELWLPRRLAQHPEITRAAVRPRSARELNQISLLVP